RKVQEGCREGARGRQDDENQDNRRVFPTPSHVNLLIKEIRLHSSCPARGDPFLSSRSNPARPAASLPTGSPHLEKTKTRKHFSRAFDNVERVEDDGLQIGPQDPIPLLGATGGRGKISAGGP